jgi:hypothetical protein
MWIPRGLAQMTKKFDEHETDIGRASASPEVNASACKPQPEYLGSRLPQCSLAIYGRQERPHANY